MIILFETGIHNLAELLQAASAIVTIVGVIAIVNGIRSYSLSQNQFKQEVMTHCLDRYYVVMFDKKYQINKEPDTWLQQYFELVNEEMFYFQVKYLPMDVIIEWMDGIIDNVVIRNAATLEVINERSLMEPIKGSHKQDGFPRLKNAFTLRSGVDYGAAFDKENPDYAETRKQLIIEVLTNLCGTLSREERQVIEQTELI
jgi:hypothetical protein